MAERDVLPLLRERGLVKDVVDESGLRDRLERGPIRLYLGVDPTAPSLHIGNLLQLMLVSWWKRAGHEVVIILGGGTAMIGDPSGKSSVRKAPTLEQIEENLRGQRPIIERFLGEGVEILNNATWLCGLGYVEFLRDVGRHFSVNEMVAADTYAQRLQNQQHLSFVEFNYRLLQAYDFLHLHRRHGVELQVGGSDQWGNCTAGVDLIRRETGKPSWVLVTPLVLNASGQKMGKTEKGALWMSADLCSPYDYYQYWINVDDRDVEQCLRFFTWLEMDRVRELAALRGAELREAKRVLAYEATAIVHGKEEAERAAAAARALFEGGPGADVPSAELKRERLGDAMPAFKLFVDMGLVASGGEARRLGDQGGLVVAGTAVPAMTPVTPASFVDGALMLRVGKKRHMRVLLVD